MADDFRRQLSKALNLPTNDQTLDQALDHLLVVLSDVEARKVTIDEAKVQLEQDPKLQPVQNLVSFEGAHVSGGLTTGDVAGNNVIKLQNVFIILSDNGGGKILATPPEASSVSEQLEDQETENKLELLTKVNQDSKQVGTLPSAISYCNEIKFKYKGLLPVFLMFNAIRIEDIASEDYNLVTQSPLFDIKDIWPEHCEFAVLALREMIQPAQEFYDLLDKALSREFTIEVVRVRAALMIPLRIIRDLLKDLISLISKFSDVCQGLSSDVIDQRRDIRDKLKSLRENLDKINSSMDIEC